MSTAAMNYSRPANWVLPFPEQSARDAFANALSEVARQFLKDRPGAQVPTAREITEAAASLPDVDGPTFDPGAVIDQLAEQAAARDRIQNSGPSAAPPMFAAEPAGDRVPVRQPAGPVLTGEKFGPINSRTDEAVKQVLAATRISAAALAKAAEAGGKALMEILGQLLRAMLRMFQAITRPRHAQVAESGPTAKSSSVERSSSNEAVADPGGTAQAQGAAAADSRAHMEQASSEDEDKEMLSVWMRLVADFMEAAKLCEDLTDTAAHMENSSKRAQAARSLLGKFQTHEKTKQDELHAAIPQLKDALAKCRDLIAKEDSAHVDYTTQAQGLASVTSASPGIKPGAKKQSAAPRAAAPAVHASKATTPKAAPMFGAVVHTGGSKTDLDDDGDDDDVGDVGEPQRTSDRPRG